MTKSRFSWSLRSFAYAFTAIIVVVGMVTSCNRTESLATAQLRSHGCEVTYAGEFREFVLGNKGDAIFINNPADSPWSFRREMYFQTRLSWFNCAVAVDASTVQLEDLDIKNILKIRHVYVVKAQHCNMDDADLAPLGGHASLRYLDLTGNPISDASIHAIARFKYLQIVVLRGSNVSPQGITGLRRLRPDLTIVD